MAAPSAPRFTVPATPSVDLIEWMRIPLVNSGRATGFTLVDADDYQVLSKYRWRLSDRGYAMRGDRTTMAREIMGLERGDRRVVDHINRDKLDNRRSNLRVVSQAENTRNRGAANRGTTSRFRGVYRIPSGRWMARATFEGTVYYLGVYDEEEVAAATVERFWFYCGMRDDDGWLGTNVPSPLREDFFPFLQWLIHECDLSGSEFIYVVEKPHKHTDVYAAFLSRDREQA